MTALLMERMRSFDRWTYKRFPVAFGTDKIWKHAMVGINLATGKVEPAVAGATLFIIGVANQTLDVSAALVDGSLDVNLCKEIEVEWWASDGAIDAGDVGSLCYAADDQTVTLAAGGCVAGRVWAVDSVMGVAVEKLSYIAPPVVGP